MSHTEFLSDDAWERISDLAKKSKTRQVAVAYISSAALKMLPLKKGDILVVDVSEKTVKAGVTVPAVIRKYLRKGVKVHSLDSLHAKVFVFDEAVVVGSTNASERSRDTLDEAAIVTTDPAVVASARNFVTELAESSDPVDDANLRGSKAFSGAVAGSRGKASQSALNALIGVAESCVKWLIVHPSSDRTMDISYL